MTVAIEKYRHVAKGKDIVSVKEAPAGSEGSPQQMQERYSVNTCSVMDAEVIGNITLLKMGN